MTFRRTGQFSRSHSKYWKRLEHRRRRETGRRLQLEHLEERQLLAVGPRLAGIQTNDGTLLREGQVRKTAPQELTFHFNDGADLDAATVVNGIRLTRAAEDSQFERAVGTTDFNTNGQTIADFTAVNPGESGNGIALVFIKNDLGAGTLPKITVLGDTINVELNSRAGSHTTAGQLRDTINNHPDAQKLVTARLRNNTTANIDIAAPNITYSPVVTNGANAASVVTNLNAGASLQVKITALQAGPAGNGIEIVINRVNFGGVHPPDVSVNERTITVNVNSSSVSPTSAQEFVNALNNHPVAGSLVRATVLIGRPDTAIGNRVNPGTRLRLTGTRDIPVEAGFIGLGDSTREIVMRFKEPLPDDLYHVEILGTGSFALRNVKGGAFGDQTDDGVDNGEDFNLTFELNLGPQISSVVPQPVSRNIVTNTLQQARNQIHVYFNNDDLWPVPVLTGELATNPSVVDPAFYKLIFTTDTVHNTDDVVYRPKAIQYDPTADLAVVQFDNDLELLGSGPGTFRLRIGTDESIPVQPARTTLTEFGQAATDFNTHGAATVLFQQLTATSTAVRIEFTKSDRGAGAVPGVTVVGTTIRIDLNINAASPTTAGQVVDAVNNSTAASQLVDAGLFNTPAPGLVDVASFAQTPFSLVLREVGSSFDTALNIAVMAERSEIISSAITPQPLDLAFPGAIDEPGHRDLPFEIQQHFLEGFNADATAGITTGFYNFQDAYGFDPQGTPLHNAITEAQKQRAREIFSLYSQYLGIQFVETENLGMTIATGDLRAVDSEARTVEMTGIACPDPPVLVPFQGHKCPAGQDGFLNGVAIMDAQDFSDPGADIFGGTWFRTAMHQIGHLLGLGQADELPPRTIMANENPSDPLAFPENTIEPIFPGDNDILHGQHLYRPDGKDIDLYRFELREAGRLTAETFAERLPRTSLLDTYMTVFRTERDGTRALIASNDDYFTNDSFIELDLNPGVYWIGVSASGNDKYDPVIEDTGLGGRSEGVYDLRLNFRPNADRAIVDSTGVELDGDGDGVPGGIFNYWFRTQDANRTLFVDKGAANDGTGALGAPFQLISTALAAAQPGDVVRIVGNGGADGNLATLEDNLAYEVGFNRLGTVLADGPTFDVPQGVTVMIDAGAIVKLRRARIGVGSSSEVMDRSGGSLQVLGTPVLIDVFGQIVRDVDGNVLPGSVYFTSIHDPDIGLDRNPDAQPPDPAPGDWGGADFRRDIDARDVNRFDYERAGIFLNHIAQADFRYGGGTVIVDGIAQVVSPVNLSSARPTIIFNRITASADAAIAASPDSFEESNFHDPASQRTPFTSDYTRVGPEVHGNLAVDNSINGMFVRVVTPAGSALRPLTVSGRWDDTDIPHVLSERLVIQGTPGGPIFESTTPSVQLVTLTAISGGELETGTYHYRVVFVDQNGNETAPSNPTSTISVDGTSLVRSVQLDNLPQVPANFVSKRLYRSDKTGASTAYTLVANLNAATTTYIDTGVSVGTGTTEFVSLPGPTSLGLRARFDARLAIDSGVTVKLNGGAFETTLGADFYAEGIDGREVIFTSTNDDRYGAGGTFDTTDNQQLVSAQPGDWGGVFIGHATRASIDHAVFAYGGGTVNIEGGFGGFNTVEVHESPARITHSLFENNADGLNLQSTLDRAGRGFNRGATIFVRGAQPIIVENTLVNNGGAAISINAAALNAQPIADYGRATFAKSNRQDPIDIQEVGRGNHGPLVRLNQLDNNEFNSLQIRGATLTTEGVWDDVDIVHVLRNETVYVPDFHTFGGLRLESSAAESLVVKLEGGNGGITAVGRPLDIEDRIGGAVHILGQPGHPVVLTSINDCTVGAGFMPDGRSQKDTANSGLCNLSAVGGNSGAVIIDGGDRDDHGFAQAGPDGRRGTSDDINVDGWQFIQQMLDFAKKGNLNKAPNDILAIGAKTGGIFGGALEAITSAALPLGLNVTAVTGNQISTVNFNDFKIIYVPSNDDGTGFNVPGGIRQAEIDLLTQRKADIQRFVNSGGSLVALTESESPTPYSWLELPLPFTITDFTGGGIIFPLRKTPAAIAAGFTISDQELSLGTPYHNDFVGPPGFNGLVPFVLDTGNDRIVGNADDRAITLGLASGSFGIGANPGAPGDWRSIQLREYSNDRNVAPIVEAETDNVGNGTPTLAEFVGSLARHEKGGDENLRLGFDIHGSLADPSDVDVYSFKATAGTEVWFDIDRTANSLDTIIELVDSSGTALARSNDSRAESANPGSLFRSPSLPLGTVNPLRKAGYDPKQPSRTSPYEIVDQYTTNPRDAGMRVVLPGNPGAAATYHVRVRSNSPDLTKLQGGLTSGNYQLQVRLRERDEHPGSTVRYSDIRFAQNGIEILGQPAHSPLLGEAAEIEVSTGPANINDTLATAEAIGNPLQSDRGAISLQGNIDLPTDVDFYQVTVEYNSIENDGPSPHASTIFDIDYADGLGRPNTTMWVFDSEGRLILRGTGSNVSEDRPGPLAGSGMVDLSRGTVGALDPFIGPVELPARPDRFDTTPAVPERQTYYVAVTSNAVTADVLRQYLDANVPAAIASVRLEPINSVQRIAEDRIGFSTGSRIAEPPQVPVLINPTSSFVPFHLGDVTLFVTQDFGQSPATSTTLLTVDPFTGRQETTAGSFPQPVADIAMRGDGTIHAFSIGPNNFQGQIDDASTGLYIEIDSATGAATTATDDGVETNVDDPMNPGTAVRPQNGAGSGMRYEAVTYLSDSDAQFGGYAVGTRYDSFDNDPDFEPAGPDYLENILYNFDINTGVVRGIGPDRTGAGLLSGAGTQRVEVGEILTYTRLIPQSPEVGDTFTVTINGKSISYTASGGVAGIATASEVASGLAAAWQNAASTISEFAAFEVLNDASGGLFGFTPSELRVRLTDPAAADFTIQSSTTNGGLLLEALFVDGFGPGGVVTGIASLNGQFFAVTDRGGLYEVSLFSQFFQGSTFFFIPSNNLATYVRGSATDLMTADTGQPIRFAGLARGPEDVEGGKYANMLFGISEEGTLYAFDTSGVLQPVFVNNQTSVDTGLFNVSGLAFSPLDRNLWTVTNNRGADAGHGLFLSPTGSLPFDNSRLDVQLGGSSIFFGNDQSQGGNNVFPGTSRRDYNFPGGAYGSVVTNPFSLKGYAAEDLPVLYFNYFLDTEDTDFNPFTSPITPTRDSLRVFVSGDDGEWTLVATNDLFQFIGSFDDEFDIGQGDAPCQHPAFATEPCVQRLFDNTGGWRQARIPLSRLAGRDNLRLRFDFSTAGEMQLGDQFTVGSELRTLAGNELRDGQTVTLDGLNTLEIDVGYTLVAPNGAALRDGNSFTITDSQGESHTFEFDSDGFFNRNIVAVLGQLLQDGDTFQVRASGQSKTFEFDSGISLRVPAAGGNPGGLRDGDTFTIDGVVFEFDTDGNFTAGNATINLIVDAGVQIPAAGGGNGGLSDGDRLIINNGLGGPNVVFEFDRDRPTLVGSGTRPIDITNLELHLPIAGGGFGGIQDGDTFAVNDGFGGPDVVFEFDKNNSVVAGNRVVSITDQSTQDEVADAVVIALQIAGLNLRPVNQGGGVVRLGVFRHSVDTTGTPTLNSRVIDATPDEIADRLTDSILNSGLGLTPINAGNGLIRLGSTVHQVNVAGAASLQFRLLPASQDELVTLIVGAIRNTNLPAAPQNLGNGEVFLGRQITSVDVTGAPRLLKSGETGLRNANALAVVFSPLDSAQTVATAISQAINGSGLGINTTADVGVVQLPATAAFAPNNSPLAPSGVRAVRFTSQDNPAVVASTIETAIRTAFAPPSLSGDLTLESNDTLSQAIDAGLPGGAALFQASGFIGDNTAFGFRRGVDVDFVKLDLKAGDHALIDVTTPNSSLLNPALRLFNGKGEELASTAPTIPTFSSFFGFFFFPTFTFTPPQTQIDFRAVTTGTYFVAVSSSSNLDYNPDFEGSADLTLRVPLQGGAIGGLTDGESFSITDGLGGLPVIFEFDSNGRVAANATPIRLTDALLQVPSAAAGPNGIQDQDSFIVDDNRGTRVRFEFDSDNNVSPGSIPIFIFPLTDTANSIATQIQAALISANLGLTPVALGNGSIRLGTTTHTVDVAGTPTMTTTPIPRTQQDIATQIRDAIRNARIGLKPTLGFQGDVQLDIRSHRLDTTLAPNLTLVSPSNTGAYDLSVEIVDAFDVHRDANRVNLVGATNVTTSGLTNSFLDGRPGVTLSGRTPIHIDSAMTRSEVAEAVADGLGRSTAGYVKQIVAGAGSVIADGEIFAIGDGTRTVNFEFDSGYSLQIPDLGTDPNALLDGESFSITIGGAVTTFEFDNNGTIAGGNIGVRFNDVVLDVPFIGVGFGGIADGDQIAVDQGVGTPPLRFEFDTDGVVAPGNSSISITPQATQNEIANAMVLALRRASIGLSPVNRGQGQVQLGITTQSVDITNTPAMTQRLILLTQSELADKVAKAIADAGVGLTPQNLGSGLVHLGGNPSHVIDVTSALFLKLIGRPGANDPTAVVIPVFPATATSAAQVAQLLQSAINTAVATRGLAVTAVPSGSRRINLLGNNLTTEFSNAPSLSLNDAGESVKVYDNIVRVIGHTVTNRGPLGLESSLAGDAFGAFNISGPPNVTQYPGALRGMNNAREGAYIDDIVIGFAERGEMITGASINPTFVANSELLNPNLPVGLVPHNEIHVGPYQLEIRRGEPFGRTIQDALPEIVLNRAFDTNDRLAPQATLTASAGSAIVDGQTLIISDGLKTVTYEFEDLDLNNGVTPGRASIGYRTADSDVAIARRVRDAINGAQSQALLKITAALSDGTMTGTASTSNRVNLFGNAVVSLQENTTTRTQVVGEPSDTLTQAIDTGIGTQQVAKFTGTGSIGDNAALTNSTSDVDLFSVRLEAGERLVIDVKGSQQAAFFDGILRLFDSNGVELAVNDDFVPGATLDPRIDFTATTPGTYFVGVSGFANFFYNPQLAGSGSNFFGSQFSTGPYTITLEKVSGGFRLQEYDDSGDRNVARDQGQLIIESSSISFANGFGILADAGTRDGLGNVPHPGPTRVTREVNVARLVPGITIVNNVLARNNSGGIRISGESNVDPNNPNAVLSKGAIPFGRIFNNTIVGTGAAGVGIQVDENASPTLLNNLLSNLGTGISVDASSVSTVVGGTVYHRIGTKANGIGEGSFPIDIADTAALFVDEDKDNFYLAAGSRAIDSSINSVQDRPELLAVKAPLGMEASPILAPDLDALGQTRVDDPTVNTPPGQGGNVFKDRGALDRADFSGPSAVMLVPGDNDQQGRDSDKRETFIELTSEILTNFSIQLRDGIAPTDPREGTGADDNTVRSDRVTVFRDGEKLIEGLDYTFHYDTTNNIIRVTPLAGIWEPDRVYDIALSNTQGTAIAAPNGTEVTDGDSFQITDIKGNQVKFEFDSGYSLRVPQTLALQIPANGGAVINDGEIFTISDGTITEKFELDSNGATGNDTTPPPTRLNIIIAFSPTDTANELANKIITAIKTSSLDLAPVNIVNSLGRAVHLGSKSIHQLDTTQTSLQQTGQAGGIEDGQSFTIDDGTKVVTFEFIEGTGGGTTTNRLIPFTLSQTNEQIADSIVTAIKAANVNLNPSHHANSDGLIHVGGTTRHIINVAPAAPLTPSTLLLTGSPGVQPAWGIKIPTIAGKPDFTTIVDGQSFSVTSATLTVTFELDSDGRNTPGNRAITFNSQTTTDQLANAIAIAIRNANLNLSPINAGGGVITLGGTTSHSLNVAQSVFVEIGSPGVPPAEPVVFVPGDFYTPGVPARTPIFSEKQMAAAIAAAIVSAKAKNRLDTEVQAVVRDDEVLVDGVVDISGVVSIFKSNIRDIAGNSLKPNRADGTTQFTIFIGSGLDYGDAPIPYPTEDASNGARHQIVGDFFLGASVDIDFDGQPSAGATGDDTHGIDDEDGVVVTQTFTGGYGGTVAVTASATGFLDAWVDFNRDGDWNDAGEQIFASKALVAGRNDLAVNVPGTASPGQTIGRFRFSSKGALQPTGLAEDGEVEDHQIELRANPWRNPLNGLDVDQSGFVVPLDALLLINDLNRNGARRLPNPPVPPFVPPPFLDTNGDGFATALDVLAVINRLNLASPEGESDLGSHSEGEGESSADTSRPDTDLFTNPFIVAISGDFRSTFVAADIVDHRVAQPEAEEAEELLAVVNEFGFPGEIVIESVATHTAAESDSLASLSDLFDSSLDPLLDGIADDITLAHARRS